MSSLDGALDALGGVAAAAHLHTALSRIEVDRAIRQGRLFRVRRGWVARPDADPELIAAVRCGGVLSCVSALARRQVWVGAGAGATDAGPAAIHVRVPRFAKNLPDAGQNATLHRTWPRLALPEPRGALDDVANALVHAVQCQQWRDAVATLDSVMFRRLMRPEQVKSLLAPLPATFSRYLVICDGRAESGLESLVRLLLRSVGIHARVQVRIDGVGRVDLLVGDRLVIETDGREWHSDARSFAADKRRDLALAERGYKVLRLSYQHVVHEQERVLATVRGIVARGDHRWSARHRRTVPLGR
ncbi:endonuclease domain-containing protein [Herbiconiux moechotypicola]|uniref:DUF559 domain-containing protein n=1 Tax=Herbiconiux moechotypicola TaxID=637393 RepID=A0ABP5R013_9MICO|nr:endonuclease domain-containing protein [Herbiconiux moechotypicola]MCS5731262.1 endonuclease domain-containing protein [Herbiconiux moechotypicola]